MFLWIRSEAVADVDGESNVSVDPSGSDGTEVLRTHASVAPRAQKHLTHSSQRCCSVFEEALEARQGAKSRHS